MPSPLSGCNILETYLLNLTYMLSWIQSNQNPNVNKDVKIRTELLRKILSQLQRTVNRLNQLFLSWYRPFSHIKILSLWVVQFFHLSILIELTLSLIRTLHQLVNNHTCSINILPYIIGIEFMKSRLHLPSVVPCLPTL